MHPMQKLSYRFLRLPFEVKMRIARKLGLIEDNSWIGETELFFAGILRRARERGWGQLAILQEEVEMAYGMEQIPVMEWIPVKERLPQDGQNVLTYWAAKRFIQLQTYYNDYANIGAWWMHGWQNLAVKDGEVTHWMPLPTGPEE